MLYCTVLQLTGNQQLQPLHRKAVHYTWTVPEQAVTSPRSLLHFKECLSCRADFINFTV